MVLEPLDLIRRAFVFDDQSVTKINWLYHVTLRADNHPPLQFYRVKISYPLRVTSKVSSMRTPPQPGK